MSNEADIERYIYDMLLDQRTNGPGYTSTGFAVAYALLRCAAALDRIADEVSRDDE
jgi:hypothetical protein